MPYISNLDVAASSFWQLARHWNQGAKAKLELSCEDGNLHLQLSAVLGHPDQPHFPHPPPSHPPHTLPPSPPPPSKKKSPSQLRRQERRKQEALAEADKAASNTQNFKESEKDLTVNVLNDTEKDLTIEVQDENSANASYLCFKCDQCNYTNATEKGLSQHKRMKHRISQMDGMDDCSGAEITDKVTEEVPVNLKSNSLGLPEVQQIDPGVAPPARVSHTEYGIGDNPMQAKFLKETYWEYTFDKPGLWPGPQKRIYIIRPA